MRLRRHVRALWIVSCCVLFYCAINYHPSALVNGFGKLVAFMAFASLLAFVVLHSAEIRRVAIAFFDALRLPLIALLVDPDFIEQPMVSVVTSRPFLALLFQRPPPISSR